jgi:hypothetical protein
MKAKKGGNKKKVLKILEQVILRRTTTNIPPSLGVLDERAPFLRSNDRQGFEYVNN